MKTKSTYMGDEERNIQYTGIMAGNDTLLGKLSLSWAEMSEQNIFFKYTESKRKEKQPVYQLFVGKISIDNKRQTNSGLIFI